MRFTNAEFLRYTLVTGMACFMDINNTISGMQNKRLCSFLTAFLILQVIAQVNGGWSSVIINHHLVRKQF